MRRSLLLLTVSAGLFLLSAAVAWACNPYSHQFYVTPNVTQSNPVNGTSRETPFTVEGFCIDTSVNDAVPNEDPVPVEPMLCTLAEDGNDPTNVPADGDIYYARVGDYYGTGVGTGMVDPHLGHTYSPVDCGSGAAIGTVQIDVSGSRNEDGIDDTRVVVSGAGVFPAGEDPGRYVVCADPDPNGSFWNYFTVL